MTLKAKKPELLTTCERLGVKLTPKGHEFEANVPWRKDARPSLRVNESKQLWFDKSKGTRGDSWDLIARCFGLDCQRDFPAVVEKARGLGLTNENHVSNGNGRTTAKPPDPKPLRPCNRPEVSQRTRRGVISAVYIYQTESARDVLLVARYEKDGGEKSFSQFSFQHGKLWATTARVTPEGEKTGEKLALPLYRAPRLVGAVTVYIVEGEKTVEAGIEIEPLLPAGSLFATSPMGAGKWRSEYNQALAGKHIVILPDADQPGRSHAEQVARKVHGMAASVKVLELPGLEPKGDLHDWLANQPDLEAAADRLTDLVEATPEWVPQIEKSQTATSTSASENENASQSEILMRLADTAEYFHTTDERAYATIDLVNHTENWALDSRGFKTWLQHSFYRLHGKAASARVLDDVLRTLEGRAFFESPTENVYRRVAEYNGRVYLDLADDNWRVVEISAEGWRIIENSPVHFVRSRGTASLPDPQGGGSIEELRSFVNAKGEAFVFMVAWIVGAFRPSGPYPIALIRGEQGTGKSVASRVLKSLVDPSTVSLRRPPQDQRDLFIHAASSHVIALDNLSDLPPWLSDSLCCLSTGGGMATRRLYTNDEEALFEASRPVILNGIEDVAYRFDLADRCLFIELAHIRESDRRAEAEFWREFKAARPRILGALLDAVSTALRNLRKVSLTPFPRMADFAVWITAAEPALPWPVGDFLNRYAGAQESAAGAAVESDLVAQAILNLLAESDGNWNGSMGELLKDLERDASDEQRKRKSWPRTARALGNKLRRIAPALRANGVEVERGERRKDGYPITLSSLRSPNVHPLSDEESVPGERGEHGEHAASFLEEENIRVIGGVGEREGLGVLIGGQRSPCSPDVHPIGEDSGPDRSAVSTFGQVYEEI